MVEHLIERMLSRGDCWFGTKEMGNDDRPPLFNFQLKLTLLIALEGQEQN